MQFMQDGLRVRFAELNEINDIAYEQADVVKRIIEFMCNARSKLSQCCQFAGLHKLFLFLA